MMNCCDSSYPNIHKIMIKGIINTDWSEWFSNIEIIHVNGNTLLKGLITDQSELHGILERIRDLNLIIVSMEVVVSK